MCEIITIGRRLAHASSLTYRFWGDASREESLFGVTPSRSHPENGGMAPHQFFENNYFSEANQLRVLTVHEGHMGHYHHWRTDDSSSSCFSAIVNVGKMRGVTPTDATNHPLKETPNLYTDYTTYCTPSSSTNIPTWTGNVSASFWDSRKAYATNKCQLK